MPVHEVRLLAASLCRSLGGRLLGGRLAAGRLGFCRTFRGRLASCHFLWLLNGRQVPYGFSWYALQEKLFASPRAK